jgi:hypothetical protein
MNISEKFIYPNICNIKWHKNFTKWKLNSIRLVPYLRRIQAINPLYFFRAQELGGYFLDNSMSLFFSKALRINLEV